MVVWKLVASSRWNLVEGEEGPTKRLSATDLSYDHCKGIEKGRNGFEGKQLGVRFQPSIRSAGLVVLSLLTRYLPVHKVAG